VSSIYTVQQGESLWDVCFNSTGTLANLDIILTANSFTDWTPDLQAGQQILIPDSVTIDANALRQLQQYPVCNNSVSNIDELLSAVFDILNDNWILATGNWNDDAVWIDEKTWID
jgi:phage tail protein X